MQPNQRESTEVLALMLLRYRTKTQHTLVRWTDTLMESCSLGLQDLKLCLFLSNCISSTVLPDTERARRETAGTRERYWDLFGQFCHMHIIEGCGDKKTSHV